MNKLIIVCVMIFITVLSPIAQGCAKAEFEISNLSVSPQEVVSEQSTTISVDVSNIGGAEGTYTIILAIDGVQTDTQDVMVGPETTQQVSFIAAIKDAGIRTIDVNGLTATLKVLKPAEFKTEQLVVSPTEIIAGRSCTVTIDVTNIGEVEGVYEVCLRLDDEVAETKEVTLAAGVTETVIFSLSETTTGTHTVSINDLSSTLVVKSPPPPPPPPPPVVDKFAVSLIEVCSDVKGSSDYTPLKDAILHMTSWDGKGGLDVWLYFEVTSFEQQETDGKYEIWLLFQELKVFNGNGDTLISTISAPDEAHVTITEKRTTTAFWVSLSLGDTSGRTLTIRMGDYRFEVEVVDKLSGETATESIDFRVQP